MKNELDVLVLRAWTQARGNGGAAVTLLMAWTGLSLRDAAAAIDEAGLVEKIRFNDAKPTHA